MARSTDNTRTQVTVTETAVITKTMHLPTGRGNDTNVTTVSATKRIIGTMPSLYGQSYYLTVDATDRYRFGCGDGRFNYAQLEAALVEMTGTAPTAVTVPGVKRKSNGREYAVNILEESENFILCGPDLTNAAAYSKNEYERCEVVQQPITLFGTSGGMITWNGNSCARNNASGKADLLAAFTEAKQIIDFIEDKGIYAPGYVAPAPVVEAPVEVSAETAQAVAEVVQLLTKSGRPSRSKAALAAQAAAK